MGETPIEVKRDTIETWLIRNYSPACRTRCTCGCFQVLERQTSPDQIGVLKVDDGRLVTDLAEGR
jgi:hypothetical protein